MPKLPPAGNPEGVRGGAVALARGDAVSAAATAPAENIAESESEMNADSFIMQPRTEEGAVSGKRPPEIAASSVLIPKRSCRTSVAKIGTMLLSERFSDLS